MPKAKLPITATNMPRARATAQATNIVEDSPELVAELLNPKTIASFFQMNSEVLVGAIAGLDTYFQMQFENFLRQEYGKQLLVGDGTAAPPATTLGGVYHKAGVGSHGYGADLDALTSQDVVDTREILVSARANGANFGWILSPSLESALLVKPISNQVYGNIARVSETDPMRSGSIYATGRYYTSPDLLVAAKNDIGMLGYWDRLISPVWGGGLDLVVHDPAQVAVRQFSIRMYTNMEVANGAAFARIQRGNA